MAKATFRLFQLVAALLVCSPAFASMPPKEFDHAYAGKVIPHALPYRAGSKEVIATCKRLAIKYGTPYAGSDSLPKYGCSFGGKLHNMSTCEIVFSYDTADKQMRSNTKRHEIGHCNGWPRNHPNALP